MFRFGASSRRGSDSGSVSVWWSNTVAVLQGLVGGGLGWRGRWNWHLLFLSLADGAESQPWKCLYGGASLGSRTVQESPETPGELHTKKLCLPSSFRNFNNSWRHSNRSKQSWLSPKSSFSGWGACFALKHGLLYKILEGELVRAAEKPIKLQGFSTIQFLRYSTSLASPQTFPPT